MYGKEYMEDMAAAKKKRELYEFLCTLTQEELGYVVGTASILERGMRHQASYRNTTLEDAINFCQKLTNEKYPA